MLSVLFLASCAPPASMRPASATMGTMDNEIGFGMISIRPRPYADDPIYTVGQMWGTRRIAETLKVSGILAFDNEAAAAGASLAWLPLHSSYTTAGIEVELGYAWFAVQTPVALTLREILTIYISPRLGSSGDKLSPALTTGVGVAITDRFVVRTETQINWVDFKSYNRRIHWALGIAYQFGETSKWASTGK